MSYEAYLNDRNVILTVAPTGGVHGKDKNQNLPEQPEEIAEQVAACEELGASICHLHARDEHGENDAGRIQEVNDAVRERCDDIVIQNTTGGQSTYDARVQGIRTDPAPDMASLDMGPFNRGQHIITEHTRNNIDQLAAEMRKKGIKPELECFNNGHINEVYRLIERDALEEPYYFNLVFGHGTFTPPTPENVLNLVSNLPESSEFNLLAVGRHQLPLTTLSMILGGHVRVGMEDNLYYRKSEPVQSNAQLVDRTARIADLLEADLATPAETRERLGIE
ncbi:3-keto-5-aminohexanoate cleavage protein [Halolamina sp. CBA1230]|uniref:3-keto-5-aminohexanoate cleavage protein n=1 Tax=Halolamina sp. CBA1230 TaxID=1853690 RepID=UPI0009A19015|nr:3-keto-5-aminohexanoate cleavage protein [Halolamina sp. CBA1230]QKY19099.1 3-keto-5-aminohexanoate cleavage protein [Halolamina sp. CBA1230]